MKPLRFQAPPPGMASAAQTISGGPPPVGTFFNDLSAKNAMELLSGDQNGAKPPSVPGITLACSASSGRSQSMRWPSGPSAANVRKRPSGEIEGVPG